MVQPYKRVDRLTKAIHKNIAEIISTLKDPRLEFITVTYVKLSPDLKEAQVYFTTIEREKRKEMENVLNRAAGYIRKQLFEMLNIKEVPRLSFQFDKSVEEAERIEKILEILKNDENKKDNKKI